LAEEHFPELVTQRSHAPGAEEPKTFEETLRELLKNSPYLVISFLIHAVLLLLFAGAAGQKAVDEGALIKASAEEIEEPIPPPPPPPEPEIEEVEEVIEDPTISEVDTSEVFEEFETVDSAEFDSTGLNDVIGVGGGGGGNFGKLGRRGRGGKAGGEAIARAVDDALRWLKNHQTADDGHWSCAGFDTECGKQGDDMICDGTGSPQFDVGVTGLALLAFLGAGNTHREGKYRKTVKAGLRYLVEQQGRDGNFGIESNGKYTYDHIIATLAMVEAYALTKDYMFKSSAEKSLEFMYGIRNPGAAWRYAPFDPEMVPGKTNDMSVTGWAILAMTLAKEYGMPLDETALEDSMLFLEEMTDPVTGITGYYDRGGGPAREPGAMAERWPYDQSESMTAVGVLCRIFADPDLTRPNNAEMVDLGAKVIAELPPVWTDDLPGRRDFYYWYYGTYALYQVGGPEWKEWEKTLIPAIAEHQYREGEMQGSWDPQEDPWGKYGGRVYSTAILALCMEVFYRYDTVMGAH
jgi:hypothetical protein